MSFQNLDLSLALRPRAHQHQTSYIYIRLLIYPSLTKYWSSIPQFLKVAPKHFTRQPIISTGIPTAPVTSLRRLLRSPYMAGQGIEMASDKPLPPYSGGKHTIDAQAMIKERVSGQRNNLRP